MIIIDLAEVGAVTATPSLSPTAMPTLKPSISPSSTKTLAGTVTLGYLDGVGTAARFNSPWGVAADGSGNAIVADSNNRRIRQITPTGVVTTLAGSGSTGYADGQGTSAIFNSPRGLAMDTTGNIFVGEYLDHRIRQITSSGAVTTFAGSVSSTNGYQDGTGTSALFYTPFGLAVAPSGNLIVADSDNHRIRQITPSGVVTTLAGSTYGYADGTGTSAKFYSPSGVAVDGSGNVFVGDSNNYRIRQISPTGSVTTLAGSSSSGAADGTTATATFGYLFGLSVSGSGNLIVTDTYNNRIRQITPNGVVTTLAGSGAYGYADGVGTSSIFSSPWGVAVGLSENLLVTDTDGHRLRQVPLLVAATSASPSRFPSVSPSTAMPSLAQSWYVTTLAGSGTIGYADGVGTNAAFYNPDGVAVDGDGNLIVSDTLQHRIRKITPSGVVTTLAGSGSSGYGDGAGISAVFKFPKGLAVTGNLIIVADTNNHRIRQITPTGVVTTLAGSGTSGYVDGVGTSAVFNSPYGVAVDVNGGIFISETDSYHIRMLSPSGVVTTLAGGIYGYTDGVGTSAAFRNVGGLAVNSASNVYVADTYNNAIRQITPTGVVTTLVGGSSSGYSDGIGTSAKFYYPQGIALDGSGNLVVTDSANYRIRLVTTGGVVTTLAGSSSSGYADGQGTTARFSGLAGVAVKSDGNVFIVDSNNQRIRQLSRTGSPTATPFLSPTTSPRSTPPTASPSASSSASVPLSTTPSALPVAATSETPSRFPSVYPSTAMPSLTKPWYASTLAGSGIIGYADGVGTSAAFYYPEGIAVDSGGNLIVSDLQCRIRKVTPSGVVTTLAGSGSSGYGDGTGTSAVFQAPKGLAVTENLIIVADTNNHRIRQITPSGVVTTLAGSGQYGYADGVGTSAIFNAPYGVAVDMSGAVFISDSGSYHIRKLLPSGLVLTLAGGIYGYTDGVGTSAAFTSFNGLAVNSIGNVYVADTYNNAIRQITPTGVVTTLAGRSSGFSDGLGTSASFYFPKGIAVDRSGNLVVTDLGNNRIRLVTYSGVVTTLAGSSSSGYADGQGTTARFNGLAGVAVKADGNVFIVDSNNQRIRQLSRTGPATSPPTLEPTFKPSVAPSTITPTITSATVATLAGSSLGYADGVGTSALFYYPYAVAVDVSGTVIVTDEKNHRIRQITPSGVVTTLAGSGTAGYVDGVGTSAQFNFPYGLTVSPSRTIYVGEYFAYRIRQITPSGVVTTLAGSGTSGYADGQGTSAQFNYPWGLAVDNDDNVVVVDSGNNRIRQITPSGVVTTLAGSGTAGYADGQGTSAQFRSPSGVAVDSNGVIFVGDDGNFRIRQISPLGVVTTFAGSGSVRYVDGVGTSAAFGGFWLGLSMGRGENLIVGDNSNTKIRQITPSGVVTTLAGSTNGYADGMGTTAQFKNTFGIAVDLNGDVILADSGSNRIRQVILPVTVTETPSLTPSSVPISATPSAKPVATTSETPSRSPSTAPRSLTPSTKPVATTSETPSRSPSTAPRSLTPSTKPVAATSTSPTRSPSSAPSSKTPTAIPVKVTPSKSPTRSPSSAPSSKAPTAIPVKITPSKSPTRTPSSAPSSKKPSN